MKLPRDLNTTQKSAWHLAHRLREAFASDRDAFGGPVEADETYLGGRPKNMSRAKRRTLGGWATVGKSVIAGVKDRGTNEILGGVVPSASAPVLQGFVREHECTFDKISAKHLDRYVTEFAGKHNAGETDTMDQMVGVVTGMGRKRLRYIDPIADNGLDSGARS